MLFSSWLSLLVLLPAALAAPTGRSSDHECKNPAVRKEWRSLTNKQRAMYHEAVKCLRTKPSKVESGGLSKNVWDDFAYVHYTTNRTIHKVASFFPWHRYFLILREQELAECGYKDPIPYWDWRDEDTEARFKASSMFHPEHGFGGNGVLKDGADENSTNWCVTDGPYADLTLTYPDEHCLNRRFNVTDLMAKNWTSSLVDEFLDAKDYIGFWNGTERYPHDNIHRAIGGDIRLQSSPNDPLFFIHHAQVDRLWTKWQGRNKARLWDYGGNTVQNSTVDVAELGDDLDMLGFAPTRPVWSVMDTLKNGLCYTYDKL